MKTEPKRKEQSASISYALKSFANNIKKLREAELLTEADEMALLEIRETAIQKYVEKEFKQ